jgi:hypothetical protein
MLGAGVRRQTIDGMFHTVHAKSGLKAQSSEYLRNGTDFKIHNSLKFPAHLQRVNRVHHKNYGRFSKMLRIQDAMVCSVSELLTKYNIR